MDRDKVSRGVAEALLARGASLEDVLFVTDLDGTLLDADSRISPASGAMLNNAISLGANFTVATARTPATVDGILEDVNMRLPAIVMTGATAWSPVRGYSGTNFFPEDLARRILEIFRRTGFPTFVYTMRGDMIEIYHPGPLSEQERDFMNERAHSPYKHFNIGAESGLHDADLSRVLLFYSIQPTDIAEKGYGEIRNVSELNALFYHDLFGPDTGILEVFPKASTKANAIARLAADNGFSTVVAFGDNINDIPMLRSASVAVAVENAIESVKDVADIVIGPNTDNSVAHSILTATKILSNG